MKRYGKLYPKAAETLCRDWGRKVAFYRFPKEHCVHLRTGNVVESPFAAVRLRTEAAKSIYRPIEIMRKHVILVLSLVHTYPSRG